MNLTSLQFADSSPYPTIQIDTENPRYAAAMLANMGSCCSEMSAVSLYVYNQLLTQDCYSDFAHCFQKMSMVEMKHLQIFGQLALALGTDPRLWSMESDTPRYWSPACNRYPEKIFPMVKNALAGEKDSIKQYKEQCSWIKDRCVLTNLRRIIKDEECHVRILEAMLEELGSF